MVKIGPVELACTEPQPSPGSSMSSDVVGAHYAESSCVAAHLLMKMADSVGTATPRTVYAGSSCSVLQGPLVKTPLATLGPAFIVAESLLVQRVAPRQSRKLYLTERTQNEEHRRASTIWPLPRERC